MRVWVTRTRPGADAAAARLRALGHEPIVEPLFEVRPRNVQIDLDGVAALAFTSAHGVEAFAARRRERDLPVFAVGDATAEAAGRAGFAAVRSAGGDVATLAELIADTAPAGPVLHAAATERAGDLAGLLASRGVGVRTASVYETVERVWTAPGAVDAVLVQSPRAGRVLAASAVRLLAESLFACVSDAAAEPLRKALSGRILVAAEPTEAGVVALLPSASPGLAEGGPAV